MLWRDLPRLVCDTTSTVQSSNQKANGMAHFMIVEYVDASEWMNELFQNE